MSSLATQDLLTPSTSSAPQATWSPPAWEPARVDASPSAASLSDEQHAADEAAAAEAGMGSAEVSTLGTFGLRPSEMDPDAARRMAVGMKRMQALLACEGGNQTVCDLAGPGLVGHQATEGVGGDTSEDLVVEDEVFTLRISTRTTADGQTEQVLFYEDIDGNYLSGVTTEPVGSLPEEQAREEQPSALDEEGLGSFLEGALLGDFAGNDTWSAVAGQTAVGLIPVVGQIADARDTIAAVRDVARGEDGAWVRLGMAGIGWIPAIGDALKGGARVGMRLGTEVVEEGAERLVRGTAGEAAEFAAKHGDEAARVGARSFAADPSRALLGAGHESHPELYAELIEEVEALGVVVKERPGAMAYGPAPSGGAPGQLLLDPDASITALLHEVQHARDDAAQGFPGMRRLFDPDARWALEQTAYDAEIRFVQGLDHAGSDEVIEQLLANRELERLAIYGE